MKIWNKTTVQDIDLQVENFSVGQDRTLDLQIASFDVLGSMAHCVMLEDVGLLSKDDLKMLLPALKNIYQDINAGNFKISDEVEDIHSEIEWRLTKALGEVGKKIHSGRSRNDQVLLDCKLYYRNVIEEFCLKIEKVFHSLQKKSEAYKDYLLPGYTHLQVAMPSSFGLWFGAYAEALSDDLLLLHAAYEIANQNPLGSGAGYGSSFPLNRAKTTELLGFNSLNINVVYAQMTRGKTESILAMAMANIAHTLGRFCMDICLYNSQNFGFVDIAAGFTTGSSIMPHKKNPDIAELLRGRYNKIKALPTEIALLMSNLPSGYHRDLQLLKEIIFPCIEELNTCLDLTNSLCENIQPKNDLLADAKYDLLFTVENVGDLVRKGIPFRDAYVAVGLEVENGTYKPQKNLNHTLEGSIGNLMNKAIEAKFNTNMHKFPFKNVEKAFENLLKYE